MTRREVFLERMNRDSVGKAGGASVPTTPGGNGEGSLTLSVNCVQVFYNLSDPAMEDLLYEAESVRRFVGLGLREPLPDERILHFRHLLERHELGQGLFAEINGHLEWLRMREGSIVDATIIEAPSSTKNQARERDPAMHQTKKGNQSSGKLHIVDAETGLVVRPTSMMTEAHKLLHGGELQVWGDAGYGNGRKTWGWQWTGG